MTILFEVERQGLLIHFGRMSYAHLNIFKDSKSRRIDVLLSKLKYRKPRIVAICFNNWRSNLPFKNDDAEALKLVLTNPDKTQKIYRFLFPQSNIFPDRQAFGVIDGLNVIYAKSFGEVAITDAPMILGFIVDRKKLEIDWDLNEIIMHFGPETLHGGVSVTERCRFISSQKYDIELTDKPYEKI